MFQIFDGTPVEEVGLGPTHRVVLPGRPRSVEQWRSWPRKTLLSRHNYKKFPRGLPVYRSLVVDVRHPNHGSPRRDLNRVDLRSYPCRWAGVGRVSHGVCVSPSLGKGKAAGRVTGFVTTVGHATGESRLWVVPAGRDTTGLKERPDGPEAYTTETNQNATILQMTQW